MKTSTKTAQQLSELAKSNHIATKKKLSPTETFEKKVRYNSHKMVESIINQCEIEAKKGFGSYMIKLDKTTDLFMMDEGRGSSYSTEFVCKLLHQKGFSFNGKYYIDHYDAISSCIVWNSDLPKSNYQIGMRIL